MTVISRQENQTLLIGEHLAVTITDVDAGGVRLLARGICVGGADDGAPVDRVFELGLGGEVRLGTAVTLAIARLATNEKRVYLSVVAPVRMEIWRKEAYEQLFPHGKRA